MAKRTFFSFFRRKPKETLEDKIEQVLQKRNIASTPATPVAAIKDARSSSLSSILKTLKSTVLNAFGGGNRGIFRSPEWDMSKVQLAFTNESLFRRAVEKYVEQIRKHKWEFVGNNPNTVGYIRKRFDQIATVQNRPIDDLFDELAFNIVLYNNCIIVKHRNRKASGGKPRKTFDGFQRVPIAGYSVVDPTTLEVDRDDFGNVRKWRQVPTTSTFLPKLAKTGTPEWPAYNVVHLKDKSSSPSQFFFSMPMSIPVLADMEALRELEELSLLESIKVAVPKIHAKVGSKEQPGTQEQVDDLAATIRYITGDGILVTTERVTLEDVAKATQANNILTASLTYFRARVLSGLGMSSIAMGEGDTANRSTAQVISAEMQSTSAKFQRLLKKGIEFYIVRELLYETGYTEFTLDDTNMVYIAIPEVDLAEKVRREAHYLNLYLSNGLTEDELRKELGRDILSDPEREDLYLHKVQIPLAKAQAMAKAVASENSSENTSRPTNQYGTQLAKPSINKDEYLKIWNNCLTSTTKDELFSVLSGSKIETYDITLLKMLLSEYLRDNSVQTAVNLVFTAVEPDITKE